MAAMKSPLVTIGRLVVPTCCWVGAAAGVASATHVMDEYASYAPPDISDVFMLQTSEGLSYELSNSAGRATLGLNSSQCFSCVKPAGCVGSTCMIVGGCPAGMPDGYYPDLTNCNGYCKCTGTVASSTWQVCYPSVLLWDTHQQGTNSYLPGNFGQDGLWGTNGGGCGWPSQMSNSGGQRPSCNGNPAVTGFSVRPDGSVCGATTSEPTASPTAAPTSSPAPAAAPAAAPGGASATGDPHLQNVLGQRFDLMKPGKHVLVNIPRGRLTKVLLRVEADVRRLSGHCADMYFQELNITGAWVDTTKTGGLHFQAQGVSDGPGWLKFGKVELKVVHGRTKQGVQYLNFYVKHLGHAGFAVGGLLGEDDHSEAAMPSEACAQKVSLLQIAGPSEQSASVFSVAEASFA